MKTSFQSRATAVRDDSEVPHDAEAQLTFAAVPAGEPPASDLIEAMVAEIARLYGSRLDVPGKPSASPAELGPPSGACLVGWLGEEPVAVGAVKRLDAATCEIKRMYVAPAGRGRGVARALLGALEDAARGLGYRVARLDTGSKQPHARELYDSAGYREIPDYNDNPDASYWGEKEL